MGLILIIVLALFAIFGYMGWKKGIIKMALSIVSIVVTMLGTVILVPVTAKLIKNNTGMYKSLYNKVYAVLDADKDISGALDQVVDDTQGNMAQGNNSQLEKYVSDAMDMIDFPESIKKQITSAITQSDLDMVFEQGALSAKEAVVSILAYRLTSVIFNAILYMIVFIVIFIVLRVVFIATGIFAKLPVINEINKTAGLVVGLVEGLLVVWILFTVITACAGNAWASQMLEDIGSNKLLEFIYNHNLILKIVFKN